jgi:hypothetical protein
MIDVPMLAKRSDKLNKKCTACSPPAWRADCGAMDYIHVPELFSPS